MKIKHKKSLRVMSAVVGVAILGATGVIIARQEREVNGLGSILNVGEYTKDEEKRYIEGIMVGTTTEEFRQGVTVSAGYRVEIEGKEVSGAQVLYTGGKTKVYNGSELVEEWTNVVRGDVNEDGRVTDRDYILVYNYIRKLKGAQYGELTEENLAAADMNADGKVNYLDFVAIYNFYNYGTEGSSGAGGVTVDRDEIVLESGETQSFTVMAINSIGDVKISSNDSGVVRVSPGSWSTGMVGEGETKSREVTVQAGRGGTATIMVAVDAATFSGEDLSRVVWTIPVTVNGDGSDGVLGDGSGEGIEVPDSGEELYEGMEEGIDEECDEVEEVEVDYGWAGAAGAGTAGGSEGSGSGSNGSDGSGASGASGEGAQNVTNGNTAGNTNEMKPNGSSEATSSSNGTVENEKVPATLGSSGGLLTDVSEGEVVIPIAVVSSVGVLAVAFAIVFGVKMRVPEGATA